MLFLWGMTVESVVLCLHSATLPLQSHCLQAWADCVKTCRCSDQNNGQPRSICVKWTAHWGCRGRMRRQGRSDWSKQQRLMENNVSFIYQLKSELTRQWDGWASSLPLRNRSTSKTHDHRRILRIPTLPSTAFRWFSLDRNKWECSDRRWWACHFY